MKVRASAKRSWEIIAPFLSPFARGRTVWWAAIYVLLIMVAYYPAATFEEWQRNGFESLLEDRSPEKFLALTAIPLTLFLFPISVLLTAFSYTYDRHRLQPPERPVSTPDYRGTLVVGLVLFAIQYLVPFLLDGLDIRGQAAQDGPRFLRKYLRTELLLILGAMFADQCLGRRFFLLFWVLASMSFLKLVAFGVQVCEVGPDIVADWFLWEVLHYLLRWAGWTLGVFFLVGAYLRWAPKRHVKQKPARDVQLRFMRSMLVFLLIATVGVILNMYGGSRGTVNRVRQARIPRLEAAEAIPPPLVLSPSAVLPDLSDPGPPSLEPEVEHRIEVLDLMAHLGIAWTISIPMIVLVAMTLGLLFVHDHTLTMWRIKPRVRGRKLFRAFLRRVGQDMAMVTSLVIGTIQAAPLQITAGLLLNVGFSLLPLMHLKGIDVPGQEHAGLSPPNVMIHANLWLGSMLLWATPLAQSLTHLQTSLQRDLTSIIDRTIARAERHYVFAGFGDLAQRTISILLNTGLINDDPRIEALAIFLPSGHEGVLLKSVVCIELNEATFTTLAMGSMGHVGAIEVHRNGQPNGPGGDKPAPTFVMGLCGDVNTRLNLETARVRFAGHYLCLARDPRAASSSRDFFNENHLSVSSVLAVPNTSNLLYFVRGSIRYPMSQIYVTQVRAMAVAQAIVDLLPKGAPLTLDEAGNPVVPAEDARKRILLIGSSDDTLHLVDSIARTAGTRLHGHYHHQIHLVSDNPDHAKLAGKKREPWPEPPAPPPGLSKVKWRRLPSPRHVGIERNASRANEDIEVWIDRRDPTRTSVMQEAIWSAMADILVVMDPDPSRELRILRSTFRSIAGGSQFDAEHPVPEVVIAAETGVPGRARNIGHAAQYYHHLRQRQAITEDDGIYPRSYGTVLEHGQLMTGDLLVDVLEDPAQRIAAIVRAHQGVSPFEASLCLHSKPGALAQVLRDISGLRVRTDPPWRNLNLVPGLAGCRMFLEQGGTFHVQAHATLFAPIQRKRSGGHIKRSVFLENTKEPRNDSTWREVNRIEDRSIPEPDWSDRWQECPDMPSCPVAAFMHFLEARGNQSQLGSGGFCVLPHEREEPLTSTANRAMARFVISTRDGKCPGVVATILSAMLFQRAERVRSHGQGVFNLTYLSDHQCHNDEFSVVTIHGNMEDRLEVQQDEMPLQAFLIRPTSMPERWQDYARQLLVFLREQYSGDWRLDGLYSQGELAALCLYRGRSEQSPFRRFLGDPGSGRDTGPAPRTCRDGCEGHLYCGMCRELHATMDELPQREYHLLG